MEESGLSKSKKNKKVSRKKIRKRTVEEEYDYIPRTAWNQTDEEFEMEKKNILANLEIIGLDRDDIERRTILQRHSEEWVELRKKMITASNFGLIIKRRNNNYDPVVKNMLYKKDVSHVAQIAHGIHNEQQALLQLAREQNLHIERCGLFIDKEYPFMGASPDGIVGEDCIVEIKCPQSAYQLGLTHAIQNNKIQICKYNKKLNKVTINKNSNWFYQIQGQLHVAKRKKCILGVWAGASQRMQVFHIERDDEFWSTQMEMKLVKFYHDYMLPELINPRFNYGW